METPETKMEENANVPEVNVNTEPTTPATPSPVQEKLTEEAKKEDVKMPESVKEVAEAAVTSASQLAGETQPKPEKVKVKKPTPKDPLVLYDDQVVLWYFKI